MRPRHLAWSALAVLFLASAMAIRNTWTTRWMVRANPSQISAEATATAFAEVPGLENVSLHTSDGLTLRGWYAPGSRDVVVIFVHGGWANRLQLWPEARLLARHGYGVLVYDSRACGESEGRVVSWGDHEALDVVAATDYAIERGGPHPPRIAWLGFSIGASTVVLAAASDPRPSAIILYATWTSLTEEIKTNHGRYGPLSWGPAFYVLRHAGVDVDRVDPLARIAAIAPRPLLMLAGDLDDDTPVPVMERVFAAAGQPKEFWVVPGAGHGGYLRAAPIAYEARVVGFLDRALSPPSRP